MDAGFGHNLFQRTLKAARQKTKQGSLGRETTTLALDNKQMAYVSASKCGNQLLFVGVIHTKKSE